MVGQRRFELRTPWSSAMCSPPELLPHVYQETLSFLNVFNKLYYAKTKLFREKQGNIKVFSLDFYNDCLDNYLNYLTL